MPASPEQDLMTMSDPEAIAVSESIYIEIQRFLFREASLLDRRDFGAWLALTTEDIHYRVSAAVSRDAGAKPVDYAIIDENLVGLKSRIDQISNPRLTRAENPPSMTRRVISNIEAYHVKAPGEFLATSYLLAYRSRPSIPEGGFYVAERQDVLRKLGSDWRLARRAVRLDQVMLFDGALSTLL
jgi:3-phenylpropionate/trans-cinnamate dioxygenase subunit beta